MTSVEDLTAIRTVHLSFTLLDYTHQTLREIGRKDVEGLVLWAGKRGANQFTVEAVLTPSQYCLRTEGGLMVIVDGPELHRINVWLYEQNLELISQVHSHPTDAYHSDTDDKIPIVTSPGGLSLVVPDFARGPADLSLYAGFRLSSAGQWEELTTSQIRELIRLEASEESR